MKPFSSGGTLLKRMSLMTYAPPLCGSGSSGRLMTTLSFLPRTFTLLSAIFVAPGNIARRPRVMYGCTRTPPFSSLMPKSSSLTIPM